VRVNLTVLVSPIDIEDNRGLICFDLNELYTDVLNWVLVVINCNHFASDLYYIIVVAGDVINGLVQYDLVLRALQQTLRR
jgi:hypothetical protein